MLVARISCLRDNRSWDPEIRPLFFRDDQLILFGLIDHHRFRDLPQHRIILKHSCDIHGEACDVTCMNITAMSPQNITFLALFKGSEMFFTASVSTPGCLSDVLMAANLEDDLISGTCTATRPFSCSVTDQAVSVTALPFFKRI